MTTGCMSLKISSDAKMVVHFSRRVWISEASDPVFPRSFAEFKLMVTLGACDRVRN